MIRVAVVTGSSRGVGLELVRQLLIRGFSVHATCRRPDQASELHDLIAAADMGSVLAMDVADPDSVRDVSATFDRKVPAVDLLINNAAIGAPAAADPASAEGPLAALRADSMIEVLRVNSVGPVLVTQALAALLGRAAQGALVVNVTSELGSLTGPVPPGGYAYAMSKAALNMVTRKLAAELRPQQVSVIAMHPGAVRTRLGGVAAELTPAQAARGMLDVIDRIRATDTGHAFTYRGDPLVW